MDIKAETPVACIAFDVQYLGSPDEFPISIRCTVEG
jgi:hypothetical protein